MKINLCITEIRITKFRKANREFVNCFSEKRGLVYCNDISKLFHLLGYEHIASHWRLFIDSSSSGLKAVLLHIGNIQPSVPVAYSKSKSETYEVMKHLLKKIDYYNPLHLWKICSDLKVVAILLGIQAGNVKFPCYLKWDNRARSQHYKKNHGQPEERGQKRRRKRQMRRTR